MKDFNIKQIDGIAFVLPKHENVGKMIKLAKIAAFFSVSLARFGIGIMILEAGIIIQIGPVFFGICHIKRQLAAFKRLDGFINGSAK